MTTQDLLAKWRRRLRVEYLRRRNEAFEWLAHQLEPHLSQGVHIHGGITMEGPCDGVTISGMTVRGTGERPGIQILGPPIRSENGR